MDKVSFQFLQLLKELARFSRFTVITAKSVVLTTAFLIVLTIYASDKLMTKVLMNFVAIWEWAANTIDTHTTLVLVNRTFVDGIAIKPPVPQSLYRLEYLHNYAFKKSTTSR